MLYVNQTRCKDHSTRELSQLNQLGWSVQFIQGKSKDKLYGFKWNSWVSLTNKMKVLDLLSKRNKKFMTSRATRSAVFLAHFAIRLLCHQQNKPILRQQDSLISEQMIKSIWLGVIYHPQSWSGSTECHWRKILSWNHQAPTMLTGMEQRLPLCLDSSWNNMLNVLPTCRYT